MWGTGQHSPVEQFHQHFPLSPQTFSKYFVWVLLCCDVNWFSDSVASVKWVSYFMIQLKMKYPMQKCSGSFCIIIDQNMMTHRPTQLLKVYPQIIPLHKIENIFSLTFTLTFSLSEAPHGSLFFERLIFAIKEARQDEKCLDIDKFCSWYQHFMSQGTLVKQIIFN